MTINHEGGPTDAGQSHRTFARLLHVISHILSGVFHSPSLLCRCLKFLPASSRAASLKNALPTSFLCVVTSLRVKVKFTPITAALKCHWSLPLQLLSPKSGLSLQFAAS